MAELDLDLDALEATAQAVNESYQKLMAGRGGHVYDSAPPEVKALFWEHWNNVESLNLAWTPTARLALIARIRQQDKALGIAHDDIMHDGEVVEELEARIRELEGAEARGRAAGLREAVAMAEANAATLFISDAVHPSEAEKNMMNGVNVALWPIKRELEKLEQRAAEGGEDV